MSASANAKGPPNLVKGGESRPAAFSPESDISSEYQVSGFHLSVDPAGAREADDRCRMHGGPSPGAPKGNRNAWKRGGRSAAVEAAERYLKVIARVVREINLKGR
jgi:hypothetical protein